MLSSVKTSSTKRRRYPMIKKFLKIQLLSFLFFTLFSTESQSSIGELVVVIMIKNEADVIVETLQPYVDGGIKRFLVLDTGSTDGTVEVVKNFFIEHNIEQGYVAEQDFVNFAVSRNYAIECAEELFKDNCFLFMPDAEWYMQDVPGLIQFCHEQSNSPENSFLVLLRHRSGSIEFHVQRLFRAHKNIRFCGVVHETINQVSFVKVPSSSYILWSPSDQGCEKSRNRWQRDKDLLLNELELNPYDCRNSFYLAQTFDCLGDLKQAYHWYKHRTTLQGWDEENFMAYYRLAQVCQRMNNWDEALKYYLAAYNMRSTRAEPLVKIAQHYWKQEKFALAYLFAARAVQIQYPTQDKLFIEKQTYDYARYDVLGCAAWYLQEYEVGKKAVEQALLAYNDLPHLLRNLNLYSQKLQEQG